VDRRHRRAVCYGGVHYVVDWDGYLDRVDPQAPTLTGSQRGSQLSAESLRRVLPVGYGKENVASTYEGPTVGSPTNGPHISMFSSRTGGHRARS